MTFEDQEVKALLKQAEKDNIEEAETAAEFNIDDFAGSTNEARTHYIKGVGKVTFKLLSAEENIKLAVELKKQGVTDPVEMGLHTVAAMMFKADQKTTAEKLRATPSGIVNKICNVLGKEAGFL